MNDEIAKEREEREQVLERDLERLIIDGFRKRWLGNTLAWVGVVFGAFVITLLVLMLVTGG